METLNYDDMTPEQKARWQRMVEAQGVEIELPEGLDPKDIPKFLKALFGT